jgi:hypothetical protein
MGGMVAACKYEAVDMDGEGVEGATEGWIAEPSAAPGGAGISPEQPDPTADAVGYILSPCGL